jgi:small-conductance mechanosensitive channel
VTEGANDLIAWLSANGLPLAIGVLAVALAYRWARPAVHRVMERALHVQTEQIGDDPLLIAEATKRVETIEDLVDRLLRVAVLVAIAIVVLAVFDLWPLLAGLGLVVAGVTLAGQSIVLDYLMGILLLLEGQFYKGDVVRIGAVEGTVLEVGFRRTTVRDNRGIVHSISNGLIRESANLTRTYAVATIEIDGIADRDVEPAIEVLEAVGAELAADPEWSDRIIEAPAYAGTTQLTSAGATLRLRGRVHPDVRRRLEQEMRRRVAKEFHARGIEPIRPVAAPPPGP